MKRKSAHSVSRIPLLLTGKGFVAGILVLVLFLTLACNPSTSRTKVMVFHAGSLSIPMKQIEAEYERLHPEIDIVREASGSRKAARKISDLNRACDVFLSADYKVIENLLFPNYTDHYLTFAGNAMVLAYTDQSRYHKEITNANWPKLLNRSDVSFGRTDPELDPCGYRTLLLLQLTALQLQDTQWIDPLYQKDRKYIRGTEAELSALLESGEVDYLFLYQSVAEQHGLSYLQLSDSVNLSHENLNAFYQHASVTLQGKDDKSTVVHKGSAITYGMCIPKNAPQQKSALDFARFILDKDKGGKILKENGQTLLDSEIYTEGKVLQDSLQNSLF